MPSLPCFSPTSLKIGKFPSNSAADAYPDGTFGWRHFAEIQQMPPSFDDDRSSAGRLQRGVLDEEVFTFDDVVTWEGGPTGDTAEADRFPQCLRCLRAPLGT